MSIAIVYNLKDKTRTDDLHEEYDEIETIEAIRKELEIAGASVFLAEQTADLAADLIGIKPDIVFNIAEGIGKTRSRESQAPCVLESLDMPYTGSDPISLGITLDKYLTNTVLEKAGVPVPKAFTAGNALDVKKISGAFCREGRWIVKPRWEGSSKGVFDDSLAFSQEDLYGKAVRVLETYEQPVIIEEYLPGDEITAAVWGNDLTEIFGMMKISPRNREGEFIYSIEQKRDWRKKIVYEGEDVIPGDVSGKIRERAADAFKALSLRDIARIDFRVDAKGEPRVIDVNPLPGLSPVYSDLVIMCRLSGKSYGELIRGILSRALDRYNAGLV
ncbi:MAG: ATP-grasp domain-containing protein [Candidatus Omnitrophota bacterium]